MDQSNGMRETLEAGAVVLGARAATFSPTVIEVYGELGLDFVWLDFEHTGPSPYDSGVFEDLTRAAEVSGTDLLVRLPSGDPPLIRKVLDAGVRNVLIPRVDSAAEVRRAVEATRFSFDGGPGERGLASGRSRAWGGADDYLEREDATVCLGVMIEKVAALDDLEAILDVPRLGFVFVGPSDLSVQLGHAGEKRHPDVRDRADAVREQCLEAGVPVGAIAHDPNDAVEAIDAGAQLVRIGGDLDAVRSTLGARLDAIDRSPGPT